MKNHFIVIALLTGAVAFQLAGFAGAGIAFLAAGVALEIALWMHKVRARRRVA